MQLRGQKICGERTSFHLDEIDWIEGGNPLGFDEANVDGSYTLDFISTRYSSFSHSN
jgi:hypothetical protein